jgi:hypothetical protein
MQQQRSASEAGAKLGERLTPNAEREKAIPTQSMGTRTISLNSSRLPFLAAELIIR